MGGRQNSKVLLTELEVDNNEIIRTYLLGKLLDNFIQTQGLDLLFLSSA